MEEPQQKTYITRKYRYDALDRLVSRSDGDTVTDEFAYDLSGNLISRAPPSSAGRNAEQPASAGSPSKQAARKAFCPDCGTPLKPGAAFCAQCGKKFT